MSLRAIKAQEVKAHGLPEELAARDALELLRTFSFMHHEKVRYTFLVHCAKGASRERKLSERDERDAAGDTQSWYQWLSQQCLWLYSAPRRHACSIILPDVLRQGRINGKLDGNRIRRAMVYLRSYSLVTYDEDTDSWSMHPLVQKWAREGYELQDGEQHVWCDAAANLISGCIVLGEESELKEDKESGADKESSEELMRQLLPHVSEVTRQQDRLAKRVANNQMSRTKWVPVFDHGFKANVLLTKFKFSMIYSVAGQYEQAEELQHTVQRALKMAYGYGEPKTRRVTIAWARTLWALSRANDSADALEDLLDNCRRLCGPDHRDTHIASVKLAEARLEQGRVLEARKLCKSSLPRLVDQCGHKDDETLQAMNTYGMATLLSAKPGAIAEAQRLYEQTWKIRAEKHGQQNIKTLESRQLFHACSFWSGETAEHQAAERNMTEIVEILKGVLGREHPHTLMAILYLARVKVELGDFEGAKDCFDYGLPIAERNHGKDHMGVLFCRYHIGRMHVKQGHWLEARRILVDVSERQCSALQGWGRYHYDRIGTLLELARAHHELREDDECDAAVRDALAGFNRIAEGEHPWERRLRANWENWKRERMSLPAPHIQSIT